MSTNEQQLKAYVSDVYKKQNDKTNIEFFIPDQYELVIDLLPKMVEKGVLKVYPPKA